MGAWMLALTLVLLIGLQISLHYVSLEIFFVFVLLFEPVLLGSSSVRKPR